MRTCISYIAVSAGPITDDYSSRFVATYRAFPAGASHDVLVIANGGPLKTSTSLIFSGILAKVFLRNNDAGWDISAYIEAAKGPCSGYDMMLCLGESNYFYREGWLKRLVEAWNKYGPGMYSPYASHLVRAHMNTTAFCCPPSLLRQYPHRVVDRRSRYEFEHGQQSLWRLAAQMGMPTCLVTWDGEWAPPTWRLPPNILWRGDQSNCLMHCNHTDRYDKADPRTRIKWASGADRPFQ